MIQMFEIDKIVKTEHRKVPENYEDCMSIVCDECGLSSNTLRTHNSCSVRASFLEIYRVKE